MPLESTGPTSLWLHRSVQAELFPIHLQCQEKEAAAVRKSCSFVLGEKAGKRLLKWEEDDKKIGQAINFILKLSGGIYSTITRPGGGF